jgi:choline kinase
MKAIILAAGRGSRMKNLTEERPKCLVELHGKPLLERQLAALRGAGIEQIAIVTGYKRELLSNRGIVEFHNPRWAETNMVASLACAQEWLRGGPCVVSYSDIFYEASAPRLLMETDAELAITYDPNWRALWESRFEDPLSDAETFKMNDRRVLLEIGQKPTRIEDIQGQYMGLLRFTPAGWSKVETLRATLDDRLRDKLDMTGMLQRLIAGHGAQILALPYSERWGEVDSAEDLAVYEKSN